MPALQDRKHRVGEDRIATVRRFNRFYTRQIGVLRKTFLGSPYSLGEARVLYEIASGDSHTATDVGRALDLDAGYLSRLLRNFENAGLIERTASERDARQQHLALSARGKKAYAPLDAHSQRATSQMLGRLKPADQARLIEAMHTIETVLGGDRPKRPRRRAGPIFCGSPCRAISAGSSNGMPRSTGRNTNGWRISRASAHRSLPTSSINTMRRRERCWIAEMDGENAGTIMVAKETDDVARLRLLLVEPTARGLGLGARLTGEAVSFARSAGYKTMTLWTHSVLTAARHIYRKAGFVLTRAEPRQSWGQSVVSEHWDLEL